MLKDFESLERRVSEQDQLLADKHKELLRKRLYIEDLQKKLDRQRQEAIELKQLLHDILQSHRGEYGTKLSSHFFKKIKTKLNQS